VRKQLERHGRRALAWLVALLFGQARRAVTLPAAPRILVVRLDERLGNLLMTLPLLESLRERYPDARIDLLGQARNQALLSAQPALDRFLPYRKRAIFSAHGPLLTIVGLRRERYDLALDATNATDPSLTQALLVRCSGARTTVGYATGVGAGLYNAVVPASGPHEIDMRLALLVPLPGAGQVRLPRLHLPATPPRRDALAVVNVGARLVDKRLPDSLYARLAGACADAGHEVLITYGPAERSMAEAAARMEPRARLAPPTRLDELATLFAGAGRVVTCDTGPMHLAVALGTPTLGIFVSTDPARYGYALAPHAVVDARQRPAEEVLSLARAWLNAGAIRGRNTK
jgi:heptosyltransferase III